MLAGLTWWRSKHRPWSPRAGEEPGTPYWGPPELLAAPSGSGPARVSVWRHFFPGKHGELFLEMFLNYPQVASGSISLYICHREKYANVRPPARPPCPAARAAPGNHLFRQGHNYVQPFSAAGFTLLLTLHDASRHRVRHWTRRIHQPA